LTLDFNFGLDHPVHGGYGWGSPTPWSRSNCQTKKLKSGYGPNYGPGTKTNWPTDRRSQCNLKLNLRHYRPVLSSERAPHMKNKESNNHWNKCNIWSRAPKGARHQDELADWLSVVMWLRLRPEFMRSSRFLYLPIKFQTLSDSSLWRPAAFRQAQNISAFGLRGTEPATSAVTKIKLRRSKVSKFSSTGHRNLPCNWKQDWCSVLLRRRMEPTVLVLLLMIHKLINHS
jgi:hypothetical protein